MNAEDSEGNTPLHVKCYGETNQASETECIEMLLNRNASLIIRNSRVCEIGFFCVVPNIHLEFVFRIIILFHI